MKLSIIVPIYNSMATLARTISSVVCQTNQDWELILVNDGSRDNSLGIALDWATRDDRIRVLTQNNAGPGAARNYGLDEAKGDYVIFIDADDTIEPNYLTTIMSAQYDNVDALLWGTTNSEISETGNPSVTNKPSESNIYIGHQNCRDAINSLMHAGLYGYSVVMRFRRDIIEKYHIRMATDIKLHEDLLFTSLYCQHINSLATISYAGYHYIISGNSLHRRQFFPSDEMFRIAQYLKEELLQTPESLQTNPDGLQLTKVETYLSKLTLSVKDMYNPQDAPKKKKEEKRSRIRYAKEEVTRWYPIIPHKTTYRIFRHLPSPVIEFLILHF